MSLTPPVHIAFESMLMDGLRRSKIFKTHREAFHDDTGLSLELITADPTAWTGCRFPPHPIPPDHCPFYEELRFSRASVRLGSTPIACITPTRESSSPTTTRITKSELTGFKRRLDHFAHELGRHAHSLQPPRDIREPRAVTKARKFIHTHLNTPLSLGQLARIANLSESHFCRIFREALGMTLTNYVNCCRIEWAKRELLKPGSRVAEISFLVGYQSISQFNRNFQKLTGTGPSRYRKRIMEKLPVDSFFS